MYLEYYRLKEPPFTITPNPRFLFFSEKHREAFNHLLYGIRERKGFIEITGEVGAGKTTLCRALLDELGSQFKTALILNPMLSMEQLLKAILMEFGLKCPANDKVEQLEILNRFLLDQIEHNSEVVLIIDEAQNLSIELLEQVRLLSNLETDERKLLQIVLMGQPELRDKLNDSRLRQLRQRITVRYHLRSLDFDETRHYIHHRLTVSGGNGTPYFEDSAIKIIYKYSQGIPRMINAVSDKSLLAGFVMQTDRITKAMVKRAIQELEGAHV